MAAETIDRGRLNRALLARQWLLRRRDATALEAVEQSIDLQAQEAKPPFLGLWSRLESFTRVDLRQPLMDRRIVRATAMRGTIHLMSASDYRAFRAALQPVLTGAMRSVLKDRVNDAEIARRVAAAREFFAAAPATFDDLRRSLLASDPACDERAIAYAVRTHLPLVQIPTDALWGYPSPARFTLADSWLEAPFAGEDNRDALALRYSRRSARRPPPTFRLGRASKGRMKSSTASAPNCSHFAMRSGASCSTLPALRAPTPIAPRPRASSRSSTASCWRTPTGRTSSPTNTARAS